MMILWKEFCAGCGDASLPYVVEEVKKGSPQVRPVIVILGGAVDGVVVEEGERLSRTFWEIVPVTRAGEDG